MKFSIAYYFVLLYLTVLVKPLIPFVSDMYQHEFDGLEHISLIHAKYGNEHLQQELAENSVANESNKSQNSTKFENEVSFHVSQQVARYNFLISRIPIEYPEFYLGKILFIPLSNQGPPPKMS